EVDGGREAAQVVEGAHLWASELFDGGVAVYSAEGDLLAASPGFPAEFGVPGHGMSMLPAGDGQPARIAITAEAGGEGPALAAGIASLESLGIHEALE